MEDFEVNIEHTLQQFTVKATRASLVFTNSVDALKPIFKSSLKSQLSFKRSLPAGLKTSGIQTATNYRALIKLHELQLPGLLSSA